LNQVVALIGALLLVALNGFFVAADAHKFCRAVFDRRHPLLLLRVPPIVRDDAVPAGVAAGEKGGVSGSRAGVGVVVIAVAKIGAVIEKHAEPSVAELISIAFEVIAAELIDHDDDNKLGARIVSGRECGRDRAKQHQRCQPHVQGTGKSHRELVYSKLAEEDAEIGEV